MELSLKGNTLYVTKMLSGKFGLFQESNELTGSNANMDVSTFMTKVFGIILFVSRSTGLVAVEINFFLRLEVVGI